MYKYLLLAVVSVGLTACDGGTGSNIKAPTLKPDEVKALNALATASGVNRGHEWKVTSSNENKADTDDRALAVKFDTDKPFSIDRVDADFNTEIHKIFTYEWQTFEPSGEDKFSTDGNSHTLEVGIPGLATAQGKLKELLNKENLTAEDQIRKAVYENLALPMTLGASELGAYRSFDKLTSVPVIGNNNDPLCQYSEPNQYPRTDFSISCSIPAELSPFNKVTTISLAQQPSSPVYYKTDNGDVYQAYEFLQFIDVNGMDSGEITPADVLVHPGIGIISIDLHVINGLNENGIQTTQTKWEWFNDNPNILEQDY